jgi:hypothetical protein
VQQTGDSAALAFLHLGREQGLEVADMGLPLAHRRLGQTREPTADGGHTQHLAVLPDGLLLQLAHHAAPADSSAS